MNKEMKKLFNPTNEEIEYIKKQFDNPNGRELIELFPRLREFLNDPINYNNNLLLYELRIIICDILCKKRNIPYGSIIM